MKSILLFVPNLALLLGAGCGGSTLLVGADPDGGHAGTDSGAPLDSGADSGARVDGSSSACTSDADCGPNAHCGYRIADSCSAEAECVFETTMPCTPLGTACACDGTDFDVDCTVFPQGYASKPVAHAGSCADAGDAGIPCVRDADCGSGFLCGYSSADGCAAQGQCVASTGAPCDAIELGCACDGTSFNTICGNLPAGYVSKPLAYAAACIDAGATFACGNVTCAGSQYCEDTPPGVATLDGSTPPDAYECLDLSGACLNDPTCACIEATISPQSSCSTSTPGPTCSGVGQVTIHCQGV